MWKFLRQIGPLIIACFLVSSSAAAAQVDATLLLTPANAVNREIAAGTSHHYAFSLASGQYLRLRIEQTGGSAVAKVYDSRGQKLLEMPCRETGATRISVIAELPEAFRLEVCSLEKEEVTENYTLRVEEMRPAQPADKRRIDAESLTAKADNLRAREGKDVNRIATKKYEDALALWRAIGDRGEQAYILSAIGELAYRMGAPVKALESSNRALMLCRAVKDSRLESEILVNLGYVQIYLGQNGEALRCADEAFKVSTVIADTRGEADALNCMGEAHLFSGEMQKAIDDYKQALSLYRPINERRGLAQTLLNLAYCYSGVSDLQEALASCNQALALFRHQGEPRGEALALSTLGYAHSRVGNCQEALTFYYQAQRLFETIDDPVEEARLLNGMAYVSKSLGDKEQALNYYIKASRIYQSIGYRPGEAGSLALIAATYYSMGEYQKALAQGKQSLTVIRAVNDRILEAFAIKTIADSYASLGDGKSALDFYNSALTRYQNLDDRREQAHVLSGIASVWERRGEKQKALDYQNQALLLNRAKDDRLGEAGSLFSIARIERDLGKLTIAREHVEEAISKIESMRATLVSPELRASFLGAMQRTYELNIDLLMRLHEPNSGDGLDALALYNSERARARSLIEILTEAHVDLRRGADPGLLERERRLQTTLSEKAEAYNRLLVRAHTEQQAYAAAQETEAIRAEYQQVQTLIRSASPRYAELTHPQPLSLEAIQKQVLDPETLLLEYALGDDRSHLWLVSSDSLTTFELPKRAEIVSAARRLYDLLAAATQPKSQTTLSQNGASRVSAQAQYSKAALDLSRMLLGQAAPHLGTKRLLIVPDGALQYIPFGALPVANDRTKPESSAAENSRSNELYDHDTRPLIIDHEIINLPSASTLAVLRQELANRRPAPKAVAVLADPVFSIADARLNASKENRLTGGDGSVPRDFERAIKQTGVSRSVMEIPRLPFSRREAEAIVGAAPKGEALEAVDFEATRAMALSGVLSQYRVIHFATHGLLNSEQPELSGIVLSLVDRHGKPQNGFLRLHEVYGLNLPAELVVLSACQTGLGKEISGEGLVGLTRGFMYAGAARVISSLWKVDDAATAELMKRFYGKMLGNGLRPAAALREAQVEMLKQKRWQAPYYWASFVLQGEWK